MLYIVYQQCEIMKKAAIQVGKGVPEKIGQNVRRVPARIAAWSVTRVKVGTCTNRGLNILSLVLSNSTRALGPDRLKVLRACPTRPNLSQF